jgi:hypothetical protein
MSIRMIQTIKKGDVVFECLVAIFFNVRHLVLGILQLVLDSTFLIFFFVTDSD